MGGAAAGGRAVTGGRGMTGARCPSGNPPGNGCRGPDTPGVPATGLAAACCPGIGEMTWPGLGAIGSGLAGVAIGGRIGGANRAGVGSTAGGGSGAGSGMVCRGAGGGSGSRRSISGGAVSGSSSTATPCPLCSDSGRRSPSPRGGCQTARAAYRLRPRRRSLSASIFPTRPNRGEGPKLHGTSPPAPAQAR